MKSIREWLRLATSPPIFRRAVMTAAVVGVLLTLANHGGEVFGDGLRADHVWPIAFTFIVPFVVATISSLAATRHPRTESGHAVADRQIEAAWTFPDENPSPVFRLAPDGRLLYANRASAPLTGALPVTVGDPLPAALMRQLRTSAHAASTHPVEVVAQGRTYRLRPVAVPELDFINVYGMLVGNREAVETPAA